MNNFSISQLAQFSGIKAHTIRIWEQRYNALQPSRSEGNTRYYDDVQLQRLLNMVTLISLGYRVADVCSMKNEELFQAMSALPAQSTASPQFEYFISQLMAAGMRYDEPSFEKLLSHCLLRFSPGNVYAQILYPLLQRTGLLWTTNEIPPATEHFITHLLKQKLYGAIDALPYPPEKAPTWVCFLREDEFHEIGLLFANYCIRSAGHKVVYLGSNVPFTSISEAVNATGAENLLTFLVSNSSQEKNNEFAESLALEFRKKKIFIAANENTRSKITGRTNIRLLGSVEDLEQELQQFV